MDENLNNKGGDSGDSWSPEEEQKESMQQNADNIRKFAMDDRGRIRQEGMRIGGNGSAVYARNTRLFIILGWISTALTAFIHPFFAVAGVVFGVMVKRQSSVSGNAIIISNIVLAAINIVLGMLLIAVT